MNFATAFKTARDKSGFTQEQASDKIGITQAFLSQLETGAKLNPSTTVLKKFAKAYGMPLPVLLFLGSTENDVPKRKREIYRQLKPIISELINEVY